MKLIWITLLSLSLLALNSFAKNSDYIPYVIQKGDSASQVLSDYSFSPLYGKSKWVEKVLKLNRLTEATAKKLEPGDVIVIPMSATFFMEKEYQDKVETMKSSWTKEYLEKSLAPKKNNLIVSTSYFVKNHSFKNTTKNENVAVKQNVMATIEYRRRELKVGSDISFNPIFSASVYGQSNADFEGDEALVAEFTPSTLLTAAIEVEKRSFDSSLTLETQYESFSTLDFKDDEYVVTRENLVWLGAGLHKYFSVSSAQIFGSVAFYRGNQFDAQKITGKLGSFIKRHYLLDVFASNTSFNISSDISILSSGVSLGYRF